MITTESAMTQKFRGFSHSRNHHAIVAIIRRKSVHKTGVLRNRRMESLSRRLWQADQGNIRGPNCVRRTVHA